MITFFLLFSVFFFFNDTATTEIYTLSLHDALPIWRAASTYGFCWSGAAGAGTPGPDRKSTRLNSSHPSRSYAVFCLKKKNHTCHTAAPWIRFQRILPGRWT